MKGNAELVAELVGRGLDSLVARRIALQFESLGAAYGATKAELTRFLSNGEINAFEGSKTRKRIPAETISQLVRDSDWKCCLCWNFNAESPVVIHHIEEHAKSSNDSYDNLILLCMDHHAKVHTKWEISRSPFPPELLRERKIQWTKTVADIRRGLRPLLPTSAFDIGSSAFRTPLPPPWFVGRESIVKRITDLLFSRPNQRITLTGMGGVGKTALALKTAEEVSSHFTGGVLWEVVSESVGISSILRNWAARLGHPYRETFEVSEGLHLVRSLLARHAEAHGPTALFIDDASETNLTDLRLLFSAVPNSISILVTSRDERVAVGIDAEVVQIESLSNAEGMEFLSKIAGLSVSEQGQAVERILSFTGCLPLALELIGKHIKLSSAKPGFTLEALVDRLHSISSDLLDFPGHRGVIVCFQISFSALEPAHQQLFRGLGIFAGTALHAEHVSGVFRIGKAVIEESLDQLVLRSMLSWSSGIGVYHLHPLLRQFASYLLSSGGQEAKEVRSLHMTHFANWVRKKSRDQEKSHPFLEHEFSNILLAFESSIVFDKPDLLSELVMDLWTETDFLATRGHLTTAVTLLEAAIIAAQKTKNRNDECAHTCNLGAAHWRLGNLEQAKTLLESAKQSAEALCSAYDASPCLQNLANVYKDLGEIDRANTVLEEALKVATITQNFTVALHSLGTLGTFALGTGDLNKAHYCYSSALALSRKSGNRLSEGNNLSNLGLVYAEIGDLVQATALIEEALVISKEIGDKRGEANRSGHLGNLILQVANMAKDEATKNEALAKVRQFYAEALRITKEIGDRLNEAHWWGNLGNCYLIEGRTEQAREHFQAALEGVLNSGQRSMEGIWLMNLGLTEQGCGRLEQSRDYVLRAIAVFEQIRSPLLWKARRALDTLDNI